MLLVKTLEIEDLDRSAMEMAQRRLAVDRRREPRHFRRDSGAAGGYYRQAQSQIGEKAVIVMAGDTV